MRGITLYLNDIVEEREREREKRRAPKAALFAIATALAGFLAGREMTRKPEPELRVAVGRAPGVAWPAFAPIEVARDSRGNGGSRHVTRSSPGAVDLLTVSQRLPSIAAVATEPHLCISPNRIVFRRDTAEDRVTISNPGTGAVVITDVRGRTDRTRSGYAVDSSQCLKNILWPGEHCTMTVTLNERVGETLELWIYSDAGDPLPFTVTAPEG